MTIGLTPNSSKQEIVDALNYAVATVNGYGDNQVSSYLPTDPTISNINNNALFVNPNTGDIAATVAGQTFARYYQYIHFAYANSADGATDFSTTVYTNKTYYGVRNTDSTLESTNPTDYVWYEVAGGFGTTKKVFYITNGTNISITVATSAPNAFYRPAEDVSYVNIQEVSQAYIPPDYITATELLDNTITDAKIALGTIQGTSIAQNTITGDLVATNTISADSIVANSITSRELQVGLLVSGDVVSFNATLGDTTSDGFWLDYSTGDARFSGNTSIGGNVDIEGLLTAGNIISGSIDTTALAETAVSQTKSSSYQSGFENINADGTRYYKMPKLKGWENYRADSDEYALILHQTIVPQSSNSTIEVDFSVYYDNDTQSDLGSVALFRSQREGSRNRLESGNTFFMNQTHNFRNIDILYPDEQSTQNTLTQTAFVVSGYQNIIDLGDPTTDRELYSKATLTTFSINSFGTLVDSVATTWAFPISGLASWATDLSDVHRKAVVPVLGYENNGTGYFSFPKSGINESANIVSTVKTVYADSGQTNAHGMLVVSRDSTTGNSIIYQAAEIDGTAYTSNELDTADQLNKIEVSNPPWNVDDYEASAVAVGDNGAVWQNTSRFYGADGVLDSQNGWYKRTIRSNGSTLTAGTDDYTGNLYGVCFTGQSSEWMSRSSLSAGAGAEQFGNGTSFVNPNAWIVVGEQGGIFVGYESQGSVWFYPVARIPVQHFNTTFRSVCFDHYRNIIWVVGDGGTILWGSTSTTTGIVFNTYNSGTTRDLYDIKYDPISAHWVAVGDGIVIIDDGTTSVNGQKVYPSSTYAYDICAGSYNLPLNPTNQELEYEPLPVVVYKGFQSATVYNGFEEHTYGDSSYDTYSATNIALHRNSVISGKYVENASQQQLSAINGHAEGLPITFYLMVGAPTGTNVIVGNPTLKITEIKR